MLAPLLDRAENLHASSLLPRRLLLGKRHQLGSHGNREGRVSRFGRYY